MAIMNAASRARPGLPAEHSGSGPEIELLWSQRTFRPFRRFNRWASVGSWYVDGGIRLVSILQ